MSFILTEIFPYLVGATYLALILDRATAQLGRKYIAWDTARKMKKIQRKARR